VAVGGKANATQEPAILGVQVTTSLYNTAIPLLIGKRRVSGRLIWYGYFGPSGGSGKKGKSSSKKGGVTYYQANLDTLISFGPVWNIQSTWNNAYLYGYSYTLNPPFSHAWTQSFAISASQTFSGTVTDKLSGQTLDFINAISFVPTEPLSANINDYGDPLGVRTITEAGLAPAWDEDTAYDLTDIVSYTSDGTGFNFVCIQPNTGENPITSVGYYWAAAPNPSEQWLYNIYNNYDGSGPGAVAWRPGTWEFGQPMCNAAHCSFPIGTDHGNAEFSCTFPTAVSGTIRVYYGYTENNHDNPLTFIKYEFEAELGTGNEYAGEQSGQQITYPELSGVGGVQIDLGASGTAPELDLEATGLYSLNQNGQANPADIILDLILSGNIYFGSGLTPSDYTPLCWSHGLNFAGDPTRVNQNGGSGYAGSLTWPPTVSFPYVLPMAGGTPGNSSGSAFQILKDPPTFDQGPFQEGTYYNVNSIVLGSDGNFYRALCTTNSDPVTGGNPYWALFTSSVGETPSFGVNNTGSAGSGDSSYTTPALTPVTSTDFAMVFNNMASGGPGSPWTIVDDGFFTQQLSGNDPWTCTMPQFEGLPWSTISISCPTTATIVKVQGKSVDQDLQTPGEPFTQSFTSDVAPGNTIIAYAQNVTGVTVSDSQNNTYTQLFSSTDGACVTVFIALNVIGGPCTLTWEFASAINGYGAIAQFEFSGLGAEIPIFSDGLTDIRNYCTANNIFASLNLNSQRNCADVLGEICEIANCVPVWNGQSLDFYPYSEVSCVGSGAIYTPRTAKGPLGTLDSNYFVMEKDAPPVTVKQENMQSVYNILDINYTEAAFDINGMNGYQSYQSSSVRICDAEHCMLYGPMNASPKSYDDYLCDSVSATLVGWPLMKRQRYADTYSVEFELPQTVGSLIDPMDLFTLADPIFGGVLSTGVQTSGSGQQDVRITELSEDKDGTWSLSAERFMYGMSAPNAPSVTNNAVPNVPPQLSTLAGSVNAPYFFEPTAALAVALGMTSEGGICIAVTGSAANYGGCLVKVSTDGGTSYSAIGKISGNPNMGVVTADYPSHVSPDTANTLAVDLTESEGELQSYTSAQQGQLIPIALVDNSGAPGTGSSAGYTTTVPYEIVAYQSVTLTSAYKYNCTEPILRGQLGTVPADHPSAGSPPAPSVFVDLSTSTSIFKYILPNSQVAGNVLYFIFPTFNQFGTGLQDDSDCTPYTYTITGQTNPSSPSSPAAGGAYTISPNPCLYQGRSGGWSGIDGSSTSWTNSDDVYFPPVAVNTGSGSIVYDANDYGTTAFTGPNQTVYVCIYDPTHAGGTPTVDIQSTNAHATTPGYFFLGTITSVSAPTAPGNSGGSSAPGGPQDSGVQSYVVECNGTPISVTNE
jgi:hypothetical protein